MSSKMNFYGATMAASDVSTYYPNNPNFGAFIFQQVGVPTATGDVNYTLVAYAVTLSGQYLNSVPLTPTNQVFTTDRKTTQFSNLKLDLLGLSTLYPAGSGVQSPITITAVGFDGVYISYTATTSDNTAKYGLGTSRSAPLKPSPPY
jgi:hypothetical protein